LTDKKIILVIDDDPSVRESLRVLLESAQFAVKDFDSAASFLADKGANGDCLVLDIRMPEMTGLELQEEIVRRGIPLPVIIVTGQGGIALAIRAMWAGAIDFIEKPFGDDVLIASVRKALAADNRQQQNLVAKSVPRKLISLLTPRERQVLDKLVRGQSNKMAAYELSISPRTIEIYRANVMQKLNAHGLADLVRTAEAASMPPFGSHGARLESRHWK
jgi:two-component system response regulator FixJ